MKEGETDARKGDGRKEVRPPNSMKYVLLTKEILTLKNVNDTLGALLAYLVQVIDRHLPT